MKKVCIDQRGKTTDAATTSHSGEIVPVKADPNFFLECSGRCHARRARSDRPYQRIANPSGLRLGSDVYGHAVSPPKKNLEKSLAMPPGIVTRGVILRALGGYMRKFNQFPPRSLRFRSLLILTGALMLLAVLTPRVSADLIAYYNFEGPDTPGFPVNIESHAPAFFSSGNELTVTYNPNALEEVNPGLPENRWPTDPDPNLTALGLTRSGANSPSQFDIPLFSAQGIFQDMTLSFAINALGNGFTIANLYFSTDAGGSFTLFSTQKIPEAGTVIISAAVPIAANNAPNLVLRIELTGGQSNGTNVQNIVDNIRVEGTIVPEPATVAGGLLGVLGLCWHQRRRLIRSVRFRRT
jgi:hypothetical protein